MSMDAPQKMFVPIRSLHHRSLVSCSWLHAPRLSLSSCSSFLFMLHVCYHRTVRTIPYYRRVLHTCTVRTILDPGTIKPVNQNFQLYGFWLVIIYVMFSTNCYYYYRHWVHPYFLSNGHWVHPYFLTNGHWVHPYFQTTGQGFTLTS